ncbi:DUF6166 domain-containing protein [Geoalkalibacter subterraneus]|uniref:Uncharacterized protein n=1 Tax=Geoalkalibacter subterraneus TaxID=483547 RepID=A0A0B5FJ81_9BACT|nr:DUF6166 domain-containing protein [Geoalkalibacter subterraneus]AJF08237.1 hypothetical protein GSUB_17280 [Geoalkalibacter subterraneus]
MKIMKEDIFHGDTRTGQVWVRGHLISPGPSLALRRHSPAGFAWGYHGSGPAQLALAILLLFSTPEEALDLYQQFKIDVISTFDSCQDLILPAKDVSAWLREQRSQQHLLAV